MSLGSSVLLPSSIAPTEADDKVTCRICRRQFSKYTCPTCNVPYCSLKCFRSESHLQCSETFYRKEVESDIRSEPSKTARERLKMMEVLKRFEEENIQDGLEPLDDDEDDLEETDLAKRFKHVDLESTPHDSLWSMLTSSEQNKFLRAIDNPSSELTQQLLASQELEQERQEPWWEAPVLDHLELGANSRKRYGVKPEIFSVSFPSKPVLNGPPLVYNMCAICVAYAYATRHLSVSPLSSSTPDSPDYHEARRIISQLVPFLTDRRTTTLYSNLSSVITEIWSLFDLGKMTPGFFSILLQDTAILIRPLPITPIHPSPPDSTDTFSHNFDLIIHPHRTSILVLSDLFRLFGGIPHHSQSSKARPNHITHKFCFYAAHILSTQSAVLRAVSEEIIAKSQAMEEDMPIVTLGSERRTVPQSQSKVGIFEMI